jgi:hypothetical protein
MRAYQEARYRAEDRGERRTAFVGFQVTPTERAELERRAAKAGRSLSDSRASCFCPT